MKVYVESANKKKKKKLLGLLVPDISICNDTIEISGSEHVSDAES